MIYSKNNNNEQTNEQGFALGGLGGLPFAGKSGFGAYLHHVPDGGKLLVLFAPHVGIDEIGRIGSLQRDGQSKVSSACGAAVGAYKELQKTNRVKPDPLLVMEADNPQEYDPQLKNIVSLLSTRLGGIEESSDSVAFVTYQMYGIIRELITACISETPDLFDYATEVAVVGGIMINRRKVSNSSLHPPPFVIFSTRPGRVRSLKPPFDFSPRRCRPRAIQCENSAVSSIRPPPPRAETSFSP